MPEGTSAVSREMRRKGLGLSNFLDRVCVCVVGQKVKILIYYRKTQMSILASPILFICAKKILILYLGNISSLKCSQRHKSSLQE